MNTRYLTSVATAARLIGKGEVIAFPTETVYGLGCLSPSKLYAIKGRPCNKPLSLHLSAVEEIAEFAVIPSYLGDFISQFLPGPITLVLPKKGCPSESIGIRVPDHPLCQEFLRLTGPLYATSANLSGKTHLLTEIEVMEAFTGKIAAILTGKPKHQVASTVISFLEKEPLLLREGTIAFDKITSFFSRDLQKF